MLRIKGCVGVCWFLSASICFGQLGDVPVVKLVDFAADVGLGNELYGSLSKHSLGVVWIDINNDGYPDVFATNGYDDGTGFNLRPHLYLNNTDGTFSLVDQLLPNMPNYDYVGALAADYDRDGDKDIFVYTAHHDFSILPDFVNPLDGPPNLLLQNQFVENGGNLNGPLFQDVAAAANLDDRLPLELLGHLEEDASYDCYQTRTATFLDYDLDGWIDLYVGHMVMNRSASLADPLEEEIGKAANMDLLYRNMGDGTFEVQLSALPAGDATQRSALVAVAGHLNDDKWPDIYVGNVGNDPENMSSSDHADTVLLNNGKGAFVQSFTDLGKDTPAAMGIDFGDINFDGKFDIYITDVREHYLNEPNSVGNTLYMSSANGFRPNSAIARGIAFNLSWGTNFADFNLDGIEDVFVGSSVANVPSVVFWKPRRNPLQTEILPGLKFNRGSAIADYDKDGDPDILATRQNGNLHLFNNGALNSGQRSFVVELVPTRSNLDAIGAVVRLHRAFGPVMTRQVKGGVSAHSQDFSNEVYFGIDDQPNPVTMITIDWPHVDSVLTQKIIMPQGNRLQVVEP